MKLVSAPTAATKAPVRNVRSAYLLMLGSSFLFALMVACTHAAGERCDWRLPAITRAALVLVLAITVARLQAVRLIWRGTRTLWLRSITGSISMLLTFFALTHMQIGTAVTLTNTFPLWVALLAWPVLRERPTLGTWFALIGGIIGVALIERPDRGDFRWASAAALAASVCTAIVMLGLNRLRALDPLAIVVHFSAVATMVVGTYLLSTTHFHTPIEFSALLDPMTVFLLIGIGVFGTGGQILMTRAFQIAPPQKLAVVGLSQVAFTLGFDILVWKHTIDAITYVGIALVVAPVAWLLTSRSGSAAGKVPVGDIS